MADAEVTTQYLHNLKEQLAQLGPACVALDTFFANGADRLAREADVERLRNLTARLKQHLEEAVSTENGAQSALIQVGAVSSIGELFVKGIGYAMGEHARVEAFEKTLAERHADRQECFGTIMVYVGKGGLPDDINVISISKLARTQNRPESAVIHEIQEGGALLFVPQKFWQLIEVLVHDILNGKLRLPIPHEQLTVKVAPLEKVAFKFKNAVEVLPVFPLRTPHNNSKTSSTDDNINH